MQDTTIKSATMRAGASPAATGPKWDGNHERDLGDYFGGYFASAAGLRSGFGAQLERARDGLSDVGGGVPSTEPAALASNTTDMARLRRIERALAAIGGQAVCVLRARWAPPVPGEVDGMLKLGALAGAAVLLRGRDKALATCAASKGKGAEATRKRAHLDALKAEVERLVGDAQRAYAEVCARGPRTGADHFADELAHLRGAA